MTPEDTIAALVGSGAEFEAAIAGTESSATSAIVLDFIASLDDAPLSNAEKERRLNVVLGRVDMTGDEARSVAIAGAALKNVIVRNALTAMLPAQLRRLMHRSGSPEVHAPIRPLRFSSSSGDIQNPVGAPDHDKSLYSAVVILSSETDPALRALLEGAGFAPLRFDSLVALDELLRSSSDICGFVIESSFLDALNEDGQRALFQKVAEYSTFVVIRSQEAALKLSRVEVGQIVARARCTADAPAFDHLTFAAQRAMHESELSLFEKARSNLSFGRRGTFLPEEISTTQLELLGASMTLYARRKRFNNQADVSQLRIRFLQGGAGAKVALVRINELPWPVIVKLDTNQQIREEALRFKVFIELRNRDLRPEVHLHAGAALIIFDIIGTVHSGIVEPAPSLGTVLEKFWLAEMFGESPSHSAESVLAATADAAGRLAELNQVPCPAGAFRIRANPHIRYIRKLEAGGFDWGFSESVLASRGRAEEVLDRAAAAAICQGDAHLGNILIQDRHGHVIDYAYSGPGHPCVDLAKLELSIFFQSFHPFGSQDSVVRLQRDLSLATNDLGFILDQHRGLIKSRTNELVIQLCVCVRDAAFQVLRAHGLDWEHYMAAKLLSSWQSLQSPNLPQSLVRTVIEALSQ